MFWKRRVRSKPSCPTTAAREEKTAPNGLKNPGLLTKTANSAAGSWREDCLIPLRFHSFSREGWVVLGASLWDGGALCWARALWWKYLQTQSRQEPGAVWKP